ncbi:unnamed protein product [Cyclocybe aegerita]|uniref:Uncharacterized protein n=1 Tax=Cyclocybe aegerita TaxID=1973307 RepID=A0A8S0VQA7_CYCAE|nr:unnamed protein product [Cyclocybe aegerita]
MKKEWARVQHVDVELLDNHMPFHDHWAVLGTPAPTLRTLRLSSSVLACVPWVAQLRRLNLFLTNANPRKPSFELGELLEVLPQMTHLEHLYVERTHQGIPTHLLEVDKIMPIALPRLSTLVLSDDLLSDDLLSASAALTRTYPAKPQRRRQDRHPPQGFNASINASIPRRPAHCITHLRPPSPKPHHLPIFALYPALPVLPVV